MYGLSDEDLRIRDTASAFAESLMPYEAEAEAAGGKLAEGAFTAAALAGLAAARGIEMPVAAAVAAIVAGTASVDDVIAGLLARPLRGETD